MENLPKVGSPIRASASALRQGNHRFYSFSIDSNLLAACSFATNREEDPIKGFQRVLDEKRAISIADYIDREMGTIPNSIVVSAQPEAEFKPIAGGKTIEFKFNPYALLIIDGQHRVFGYSKAKTSLRVPVVLYDNLTREQEARLFIDINTKQKPVPKELLLAIKSLAQTESDEEARLAEVFDFFDSDSNSALLGLTSSTKAARNKISRVTFNAGLKPHLKIFSGKSINEIYKIWNGYFHAVMSGLKKKNVASSISNKTTFRAFCEVFPDCAQRVSDRFGKKYSVDNFDSVIEPIFTIPSATFKSPGSNHTSLSTEFKKRLKANLIL